ncbi:DUF4783 domain-containing protein [Pontibacter pamirensis]|uniref:DUF4783 domain-containing protein n=1 Tax=Pontibacter pamirensis TaxID=2562824 RepID=UPI00138A1049|nr:DUF4783 domain-containing protein [Pontibacter pamirensis]
MKNFKHIAVAFSLLMVAAFFSAGQVMAQSDAMSSVKSAMKTGSAKELSKSFSSMVELTLDGNEATSYSNTQAEFVMKNFFAKNAPVDFSVNHNGTSDKGQLYAIGTYAAKGDSYTVLIRMKSANGKYLIHSMNFIKD